jgi:hypothetical protein
VLKSPWSLLLCLFALAAGCAPASDDSMGQLRIPLTSTGSQGGTFLLEGMVFITDEAGQTRVIGLGEEAWGTTIVSETLRVGTHQVRIDNPSLRRVVGGVATPVQNVELRSENPQTIVIEEGQTTRLTFKFFAGEEVTFAEGELEVDFEVEEEACSDEGRLVAGLAIAKVTLNQGVQIDLATHGAPVVTRNAPVVFGRPGLLRVHVAPGASWQPHEVRARLVLSDGTSSSALETRLAPSVVSNDADLTTTFNFTLDAAMIDRFADYRVELLEESCSTQPGAPASARFPATGFAALGAENVGVLSVALLPVRYGFDRSRRVPNLDAAVVARVRQEILRIFPVADVNVEVLAPIDFTAEIRSDGTGYPALLEQVTRFRQTSELSATDKYVVAMVQPRATFSAFCGAGCVSGLAPLNPRDNSANRVTVDIGYPEADLTYASVLRHLGNTHGRSSAPGCGAAGVDPSYPYAGGEIGRVGYDITTGALHATTHKDMMSICAPPSWVSDYTFKALAARVALEQ